MRFIAKLAVGAISAPLFLALALPVGAADPPPTISPFTASTKPLTPDTGDIIADKGAAIALGKALFWDVRAGSDGMACASCHFAAGADIRIKNQVAPGVDDVFGTLPSGRLAGPNVTLGAADFPTFRLSDPNNRESTITYQTDDRVSSSGTFSGQFVGISDSEDFDRDDDTCDTTYDATNPFHKNGRIHRKVEPRQTPTTINSAFNVRQFWDGRANRVFNGVDPFGRRTNLAVPNAGILVAEGTGVRLAKIELNNSSLASQAVGPPLSTFEMSCAGRKFADIGRRLIRSRALARQSVRADDSVFGQYGGLVAGAPAKGLTMTYGQIIRYAFNSKYWGASAKYKVAADGSVTESTTGYTQMEANFPLFWGLAIQAYEHTLISDKTRFDAGTLSLQEQYGKAVFTGQGKCVNCHNGPLFTGAAAIEGTTPDLVERMKMGDGGVALYDHAFYNIGVRPTGEDIGVGGEDPYGNPLSFSRQYVAKLRGLFAPDRFDVDACGFEVPFVGDIIPKYQWKWVKVGLLWVYQLVTVPCSDTPTGTAAENLRVAVDGAMKTPTLRNVGLTPPYFHNGTAATLEQVVEFYNRGGNSRRGGPCASGDTTGFGKNCSNRDPDIQPLFLSASQKSNLVAFLKTLTDDRVACHSEQFDHPELPLFLGHDDGSLLGKASDALVTLPAVGKGGLPAIGKPCFPNTGDLFGETQATLMKVVATGTPYATSRVLNGSAGADTLTGAAGRDIYTVSGGGDTYVGFLTGEDQIDYRGTGVKNAGMLVITAQADGLLVKNPNGSSYLLKGIGWSGITADDVLWDN